MGKVILSGIVPPLEYTAPIKGILASDIAVGSSVYLMEGGVATDYLAVNQGIPSASSLYDASCDGLWLLRKDIHSERQWNSSNVNDYANSTINTWLNGDFFNSFGSVEQAAIKQVKIPYRAGGGSDQSGANGLSCKVFLLSGYEVGFTTSDNSYIPVDGAKLDYFDASSSKRIAYLNGLETIWWLRSPRTDGTKRAWNVQPIGILGGGETSYPAGIRPALVLPNTAVFDKETLILKGVT